MKSMRPFAAASAAAALLLLASVTARAQPAPKQAPRPPAPLRTEINTSMVVDKVGDAKVSMDFKFPPELFKVVLERCRPWQPQSPNDPPPAPKPPQVIIFMRIMELTRLWIEFENVRGGFDEPNNTVHLEFSARGLSRMERGDLWEGLLGEERDIRADQVNLQGHVAVIRNETMSGNLVMAATMRVEVPSGSDNLQLLRSPLRLGYHLPAAAEPVGGKTSVDFRFEAKPWVMTCAAKFYSLSDKFPQLWVARTILKNNGDQPIKDYRVRFRLAEYATDWSEWKRCAAVLPGQTVADAYFPVLDIDKVNKLEGRRATTLKVEYEYKQADGKVVRDDDTRRVDVLGRNEQMKCSLPIEQTNNDFLTISNFGPLTLACFVTKDDPVIREVAGMISGKIPGLDAVGWNDESAIAFMHAIYDFMHHNKIAYQLSPFLFDGKEAIQHVKYGRDVLQNRAGTCIDLAIFFGSVCEAVGLEPVLFLVPGHCYPAIRLPKSKQLFAVESTRIQRENFLSAAKEATEQEMQNVLTGKTPAHVVDIMALRKLGVSGMELPALPGGTVEAWKYEKGEIFNLLKRGPGPGDDPNPRPDPVPPMPAKVPAPIGTWTAFINVGGVVTRKDVMLNAKGEYQAVVANQFGRLVDVGTFAFDDSGTMVSRSATTGQEIRAVIRWVDKNTITATTADGAQVTYKRAQ